jgi:hypothetical protein
LISGEFYELGWFLVAAGHLWVDVIKQLLGEIRGRVASRLKRSGLVHMLLLA